MPASNTLQQVDRYHKPSVLLHSMLPEPTHRFSHTFLGNSFAALASDNLMRLPCFALSHPQVPSALPGRQSSCCHASWQTWCCSRAWS